MFLEVFICEIILLETSRILIHVVCVFLKTAGDHGEREPVLGATGR